MIAIKLWALERKFGDYQSDPRIEDPPSKKCGMVRLLVSFMERQLVTLEEPPYFMKEYTTFKQKMEESFEGKNDTFSSSDRQQ
eukprot:scaffold1228_cov119-Cylindrotheca_fusiformis.AAC.1